jgi:hypothetical protein
MKLRLFVSVLISILAIGFIIVGCEDDDDDSGSPPYVEPWGTVIIDSNEIDFPNIDSVRVRSSATELEINLSTYSTWNDPFDYDSGFTAAFFLDTDSDASTGLSSEDENHYSPNDIGADYIVLAGAEDIALFSWDASSNDWSSREELFSYSIPSDSSSLSIVLELSAIENPDSFHLVIGWILYQGDGAFLDWAPNDGHAVVEINHAWEEIYLPQYPPRKEYNCDSMTDQKPNSFWLR